MTAQELKERIDQEISKLDYPAGVPGLYLPEQYIIELGGKRLRPLLTLLAANMFNADIENAIGPALAMEVFHNFSLVHDDIMDEAPLRRGSPTVHTRWNLATAILSGDVMLVHAYELLCNCNSADLPALLHMFNATARQVCEGQRMDMDFETATDITSADYLEMIRLKTSVLLGCSAYCGAIAGGASKTDAELLYAFGESLGISFQLQDDILDSWGDSSAFGKQTGGDIIRNKKTFLYLKCIELCDDITRDTFISLTTNTAIKPEEKVAQVIAIYESTGVRKIAEQEMEKHYINALQKLDALHVAESRKSAMLQVAKAIYARTF